jgi:hypothetical protein
MRNRWLAFFVLAVLVLCSLGAAQESNGAIRGYVFRDANKNGVFDAGEEGIAEVLVTVSRDDQSQTLTTQAGDAGPGSFVASALEAGDWMVTVAVPDGYLATTPAEFSVTVLEDGPVGVNFGLYGSGPVVYSVESEETPKEGAGAATLPETGTAKASLSQWLALLAALGGLMILLGTPWCVAQVERVQKR